jgi:dephospho-CoA kinase
MRSEERSLKAGLPSLARVFGNQIFLPDGRLDRRALGRLVFSDRAQLDKLNNIVHPFLIDEIGLRIESLEGEGFAGIVVADAALIFEWNLVEIFDATVVVSCDERTQLSRIGERDSLEADEALARIRSQIPQAEKIARADFHIVNSGSPADLEKQARVVWERLSERLAAKRGGTV